MSASPPLTRCSRSTHVILSAPPVPTRGATDRADAERCEMHAWDLAPTTRSTAGVQVALPRGSYSCQPRTHLLPLVLQGPASLPARGFRCRPPAGRHDPEMEVAASRPP